MSSIPPIRIPIIGDLLASGVEGFYFISNSNKFYLDQELSSVATSKATLTLEKTKSVNAAYRKAYEAAQENYQIQFKKSGSSEVRFQLAEKLAKELKTLTERKEYSIRQAMNDVAHYDDRIRDLQKQLKINHDSTEIFRTTVRALTGEDGFQFKEYNFTLVTADELAKAKDLAKELAHIKTFREGMTKAWQFKQGIEAGVKGLAENITFIQDTMSRSKTLVYYDENVGRQAVFNPSYNEHILTNFAMFSSWLEAQITKFTPYLPPDFFVSTQQQGLTEMQSNHSNQQNEVIEILDDDEEEAMKEGMIMEEAVTEGPRVVEEDMIF